MTGIADALETLGVPSGAATTLESGIVFVLALLVLYVAGRVLVLPLVARILDRRDLDEHARRPLMRVAWGITMFAALAIAFGLAGLEHFLLAFAGVAAAATLAVGLASQNVIRNLVSGVFIYVDKPFRLGDWIVWNDQSGVVKDIRLRTTRIRTFDNEQLTVPNAELTENVVMNPVANDRIRQRFSVGIGFDDDIGQASAAMIETALEHPDILDDPEPSVRLTELGDSAVLLEARFWVADPNRADFVRVRGEYGTNVKERFDAEGIDIPFPIRTLDGSVTVTDPDGAVDA